MGLRRRVGRATRSGSASARRRSAARVGGTGAGTWSHYRSLFVGEATLPAGTHRLEFRPDGPIRDALLDLRAVVLSPRADEARTGRPVIAPPGEGREKFYSRS